MLDNALLVSISKAREHINLPPLLRQCLADLTHINILSTRFFASNIYCWITMNRD